MYFDYAWITDYLESAPPIDEAARLLNTTGLETEVDGDGLEIEHTVNRPDAMCHFGVARELSVKLNIPLVEPQIYQGDLPPLEDWQITSADPDQCSRFMALSVAGVRPDPSPDWLVSRLESIGQTCHNVLVDLTNFLLWEFSHPSHAFDADKLQAKRIHVRFGAPGERLTTLDGRDHEAQGLLCVTDPTGPVAFAGVMGGQNTEVDDNTKNLLLELACFRPATVRRTARVCNIQSDAKHRFERGIDREKMHRVIRRFLFLLQREQPQARLLGLKDMDLEPFKRCRISLRRSQLDRVLGIQLDDSLVTDLLTRMDFCVERASQDWKVTVPGYKVDISREIDVIEEIIRFAGLDLLHATLPEFGEASFQPDRVRDCQDRIRQLLVGHGYQETCTYSFLKQSLDQHIGGEGDQVVLRNPMSDNQAVMRRNILPNLLEAARRNINRGLPELSFFEIGHTFQGEKEPPHLAVLISTGKDRNHWWQAPETHPFYKIKGIFESLQAQFGWQQLNLLPHPPEYLKPEEALGVYLGKRCIGGLGSLMSSVAKHWDLDSDLAVMELDLSFVSETEPVMPMVKTLSPFPAMKFDMAFVVDQQVSYQAVEQHVYNLKVDCLELVELFDIYQGKAVGDGKKSLGFRFKFQANDRTLTSEEMSKSMDRIVESVVESFGAIVRI